MHKITIDANYATLVMNALCLDSLAASLVPSYNVLDGSKQLLEFHYHSKSVFGLALFRKLVPVAQFVKSIGDFFLSRKLLRQKSAVELE